MSYIWHRCVLHLAPPATNLWLLLCLSVTHGSAEDWTTSDVPTLGDIIERQDDVEVATRNDHRGDDDEDGDDEESDADGDNA